MAAIDTGQTPTYSLLAEFKGNIIPCYIYMLLCAHNSRCENNTESTASHGGSHSGADLLKMRQITDLPVYVNTVIPMGCHELCGGISHVNPRFHDTDAGILVQVLP